MKNRLRKGFLVFFLILTAGGALGAVRVFRDLQDVSISALLFGFFCILTGVGLEQIIYFLLKITRLHRETAALRRKKEAMEAVQAESRKLAHHQRLQIIGTLTAAIAHEFNNLLTPIMGYSMMALEKLDPEAEVYEDLVEVYNTSRKAKTIISRLSDLSRKNTGTTFHQVCPDELVRRTLEVAAPAKPREVELKLDLNCWDQRIEANEIQISQLLLNLILNSFHAMGKQGILTVGTSFDGEHIQFQISDTGHGIPPEIREQIFEPFFTTKEAGEGTGLGLAIVAQVVEEHQGTIHLQSTPGQGTTFTITLPKSPERF